MLCLVTPYMPCVSLVQGSADLNAVFYPQVKVRQAR